MTAPLQVGLIGAGPWPRMVTGPALAAGPETVVTGVWSRTGAHASELAQQLGVPAFDDLDALLDLCEAVAIAVAPDAQPALAVHAARRGKALLLEKPLGADVAGARAIVEAVNEGGVGALVMLSNRFNPGLDDFVAAAAKAAPLAGGRGCFFSGAFLGGPFARGWRLERGAVLDIGPHLLDLLEAGLGPIVDVRASGDALGWVSAICTHASGTTSSAAMCSAAATESKTELEVYGREGSALYNGRLIDYAVWPVRLRQAFASVAAGGTHPASVQHGLHLQELIALIEAQLS